MQRILMLLTVALVVAAMALAMAMPAFADPNCTGPLNDRPASCFNAGPGQPGFHGP
jgi:hypothetical protein